MPFSTVLCILYPAMGDFPLNATCPLEPFLSLGTDWLYCVTKGGSLFFHLAVFAEVQTLYL